MKKKLPMAPVRATGRGTWARHSTSMVAESRSCASACASTDITNLRSSGLSSSA
jgi:hypothetical protein